MSVSDCPAPSLPTAVTAVATASVVLEVVVVVVAAVGDDDESMSFVARLRRCYCH